VTQLAFKGMTVPPRAVPDVCRNRHRNNPRSRAANEQVHRHKAGMRARLLALIAAAGMHGATLHELAAAVNKEPHKISGRLSELKADNQITETAQERGGAAVLVIARQA
jgi:hypothetical protein